MKPWLLHALLAMVFAGMTSVVAKMGLTGISGELGLAVRTVFVFVLITAFALVVLPKDAFGTLSGHNLLWLGVSAVTTSLSWIFYYKALKVGEVANIALVDKGSILVAIVLAAVILKEPITSRILLGGGLIVAGLLVIARK